MEGRRVADRDLTILRQPVPPSRWAAPAMRGSREGDDMRSLLVGAVTAMALVVATPPAKADPFGIWSPPSWATWYPWCAHLNIGFEQVSCAYTSFPQCMATVRGVGGYCAENLYPPPPQYVRAARKAKKKRTR